MLEWQRGKAKPNHGCLISSTRWGKLVHGKLVLGAPNKQMLEASTKKKKKKTTHTKGPTFKKILKIKAP
jgi:hypothetical protein